MSAAMDMSGHIYRAAVRDQRLSNLPGVHLHIILLTHRNLMLTADVIVRVLVLPSEKIGAKLVWKEGSVVREARLGIFPTGGKAKVAAFSSLGRTPAEAERTCSKFDSKAIRMVC